MYLASLCIRFDIDPSIPTMDKSRLLLSIREKLKQKFKNKLVLKIDDQENSMIAAFLEINFEKMRVFIAQIVEHLESKSEARIESQHEQIFTWFDGQFVDSNQQKMFDLGEEKNNILKNNRMHNFSSPQEKTIVYSDYEDEESIPIPSRFTRRNFRIPTRK